MKMFSSAFLYVNRYDKFISLMKMYADKTLFLTTSIFFLFIHPFIRYDHAEMLPFGG